MTKYRRLNRRVYPNKHYTIKPKKEKEKEKDELIGLTEWIQALNNMKTVASREYFV